MKGIIEQDNSVIADTLQESLTAQIISTKKKGRWKVVHLFYIGRRKVELLISQYTEISPDFKKLCCYDKLTEIEKRIKDKVLWNHIRDL